MSDDAPFRTTPRWDLVAAVVYLGLTQAEVWFFLGATVSRGTQVAGSVVLLAMVVPIAVRSTHPVAAYFSHGLLIGVATLIGLPGDVYPFGNLFLLATLASVATPRVAWLGLATGLAGVASYFWRFGQPVVFAAFTMSLWALAWVAGRAARSRRREVALAHERDLSVETARANDARLRLEEQRRDIAREIHDLVGHTVNVMVVHASAGRRALDADPAIGESGDPAGATPGDGREGGRIAARRALATVEEVGRAALDELDGLLATLSDGPGERRAVPGLADLDRLVTGVRRAGLDVTLVDEVDRSVPRAVGTTVYRVVQEALTNTLKHADATRARVRLAEDGHDLVVEVRDDGVGDTGGDGHGLAGMGDRLAVHGGSLAHGSGPDGGYEVTLSIPVFP